MKKQATAKNDDMHRIVITALLLKSGDEVVVDDETWQQAKLLCANGYYLEKKTSRARGRHCAVLEERAMSDYQLYQGDCLDILPTLAAGSINLAILDIPYFGVKDDDWDNQWPSLDGFLGWVGDLCKTLQPRLAPNGSLYIFATPKYAARVELVVVETFNVLNHITWRKPAYSTKAEMFDKETMRGYFPSSERVIFAEQYGADRDYQGALIDENTDYWTACEVAKQGIFGGYLQSEFERAGVTRKQIAALFPSKTGGLTGCVSNWVLGYNIPTPEQYHAMRDHLNSINCKTDYLRREYDYLRREYEELRREYEELRRPFNGSPDRPYTDVWEYPTVQSYAGKHPCEKPLQMMLDIIETSSRPGDVVFDGFFGSGVSGETAGMLKRRFIGCDITPRCFEHGRRRVAAAFRDWDAAMVRVANAAGDYQLIPKERATGKMMLPFMD